MLPGLLTIAALVAVMVVATPVPRLTVVDDTAQRPVLCRAIGPGERVTLAFTNSMYGGDVREEYTLTRQGALRREAMFTQHPAAADYYAFTASVIPEGDLFRVDVPPAEYEEIAVRIDHVGRPRLIIGDEEIPLLAITGDQHRVILGAELASRFVGDTC